jgi:hypothetical protein
MSFPLSSRTIRLQASCPSCGRDWDQSGSPTGFNAIVEQFITRQRGLRMALEGQLAAAVGYTLNIEADITDAQAPAGTISSEPQGSAQ